MYQPLSVCIPAYNEEATIGLAIQSVLRQSYPAPLEVLVGANGCTDRTEEVAKHYDVRLLSIQERGKPVAWNTLRRKALHEYLVFMDGDVQVAPDAFQVMYDTLLDKPTLAAVTAVNVPIFPSNRTSLDTFTVAPPGELGCLSGRLYMIRAGALQEAMNTFSFSEMPANVINEDYWVTCLLGNGRWTTAYNATVFFTPPTWNDYCRVETRIFRGRLQMHREYPELVARMGRHTNQELMFSRWQRLMGVESYRAKCHAMFGFVARKVALSRIRRHVLSELYSKNLTENWLSAPSSKIPCTLSAPDLI